MVEEPAPPERHPADFLRVEMVSPAADQGLEMADPDLILKKLGVFGPQGLSNLGPDYGDPVGRGRPRAR